VRQAQRQLPRVRGHHVAVLEGQDAEGQRHVHGHSDGHLERRALGQARRPRADKINVLSAAAQTSFFVSRNPRRSRLRRGGLGRQRRRRRQRQRVGALAAAAAAAGTASAGEVKATVAQQHLHSPGTAERRQRTEDCRGQRRLGRRHRRASGRHRGRRRRLRSRIRCMWVL
jgi:hypothetical protein